MASWMGRVVAKQGYLVGGVRVHRSVRFATEAHAHAWLTTVARTNREAGRVIDWTRTRTVYDRRQPEA